MAVRSVSVAREVASTHPEKKVTLAFLLTGLAALLIGALIGPLQAFNYGNIDLYEYFPFLQSYYQGLTIHGVMNALVFTTFFISGLLFYLPARELNIRPHVGLAWAAYFLMVVGLLMAAGAVLANTSNVLYTFYPPMQAHPAFYIGLALVVVGSLIMATEIILMRARWKRENPGAVTPIVTYMCVTTMIMWWIAAIGIVIEVVVLLIPWSLGWVPGVDPQLAKTLFWWTGHPIVYFWVLPAYIAWYVFVPRFAGGELVSDSLARLAFIMFLLFSTPVGFHHQFTDPGIPAGWKMVHSLLTMMVGIPSLLTAFTVSASIAHGAKLKGAKGLFGWYSKLPWDNPSFVAPVLAMISFIFGGAGGIVNASFELDMIVHNTVWIPGHFHITVGTATTLTFFGLTFWLIPHLTRKPLVSRRLALWSSWLWFIGMMVFALGMHWEGLLGVPRRAHISAMSDNVAGAYANAQVPMMITAISGVILLIAVILYFSTLIGTLLKEKLLPEDEPAIPFADVEHVRGDNVMNALDNLTAWTTLAVFLVVLAYAPTLYTMFTNQVSIPGMAPW